MINATELLSYAMLCYANIF